MKKEDLNSCMLYKLGTGDLCILLDRNDDEPRLYSVYYLGKNTCGGMSDLSDYSDNLVDIEGSSEFDIIAIKQFDSQNEVLYHVLNNIYPKEWDWERSSTTDINISIHAQLDKQSMQEIHRQLDELQEKINNITVNLSF